MVVFALITLQLSLNAEGHLGIKSYGDRPFCEDSSVHEAAS